MKLILFWVTHIFFLTYFSQICICSLAHFTTRLLTPISPSLHACHPFLSLQQSKGYFYPEYHCSAWINTSLVQAAALGSTLQQNAYTLTGTNTHVDTWLASMQNGGGLRGWRLTRRRERWQKEGGKERIRRERDREEPTGQRKGKMEKWVTPRVHLGVCHRYSNSAQHLLMWLPAEFDMAVFKWKQRRDETDNIKKINRKSWQPAEVQETGAVDALWGSHFLLIGCKDMSEGNSIPKSLLWNLWWFPEIILKHVIIFGNHWGLVSN